MFVKTSGTPLRGESIDFFKNSVLFQTKLPVSTPSSMSEPLPASRQLSTASSLDEILSSSPTGRSEAQTDNVLAPKVTTEKFFHPTKDPLLRGWVRKFCHRCYIRINRHARLLNYILLGRATFLLYNDTKPMSKRNK